MAATTGTLEIDCGTARLTCLVDGPAEGPLVLCAHGFPDCARSFRFQVAPLVEAGYRVVRPWMRGYAPSSLASDGAYDAATLGQDLCTLAERLSDRQVRLVGHDWGAIAAYAATARAPQLFSHLATAAVPHLRVSAPRFALPAQLRRSWYIGFFQLRGLAERRVAADGHRFLAQLWRDWSPDHRLPAEELRAIEEALTPPGHLTAALGYYRALLSLRGLFSTPARLLLAKTTVPACYFHGARDGCIGVSLCDGVESAYRAGVEVHRLADAGHFLHQERPEEFNRLLLAFLSRGPAQPSRAAS